MPLKPRKVYSRVQYLRLSRGGEPKIRESVKNFEVGKALKIKDGKKVVMFACGAIIGEAIQAAKRLGEKNIFPAIYSFPSVKPIDADLIKCCAKEFNLIVTIEEHNLSGGFGAAVAEVFSEIKGAGARLIRLGINDCYSEAVGSREYLRKRYKISTSEICKKIMGSLDFENFDQESDSYKLRKVKK
jgi:transketolase